MKPLSTILSSATFLFLLAAGAVVAEKPPLPTLTFFNGEEEVASRPMTKPEHTAFMKFQHAMGVDRTMTEEELESAAMSLAAASLSAAASEMTVSKTEDDHVSINADFTIDSLAEAVAEGGLEIGKYAERIGKAAENLKKEIARNSKDIDYDSVTVGEGEDEISISFN